MMKHIRKFNENRDYNYSDYIKLVFADFIDNGAEIDFYDGEEDHMNNFDISINEPVLRGNTDIDDHIKNIEEIKELNLEIKSCIDKVKSEFNNINVDFSITETGENNAWDNSIERTITIKFEW